MNWLVLAGVSDARASPPLRGTDIGSALAKAVAHALLARLRLSARARFAVRLRPGDPGEPGLIACYSFVTLCFHAVMAPSIALDCLRPCLLAHERQEPRRRDSET